MDPNKVGTTVLGKIKGKVAKTVLNPLNEILDDQISDISTTLGLFAVRSIRGKLQRSITFTIGTRYSDRWMEEALYGILYEYNNIRASSKLELANKPGISDGSGMYYRLNDGTHNLKYRKYDILLNIQTKATEGGAFARSNNGVRIYTIITYDLSLDFVKSFERDMLAHRNSLLKIRSDSPTISIYQDLHENDGYTYWEKTHTIPKRRIGTIYIPDEQKRIIVDTINEFFANKAFHNAHGIAHNLKILLYGPPGPQPISSMVPTPTGWRRMEDLNPGDQVFSGDGRPTNIEAIIEYEPMNVYEIELEWGQTIRCSPDHKFFVIINSMAPPQEMTVSNIRKQMKHGNTVSIPNGNGVEYPHRDLPINPYDLGAVIAKINYHKTARCHVDGESFTAAEEYLNAHKNDGHYIPDDYRFSDQHQLVELLSGILTTANVMVSEPPFWYPSFETKNELLAKDMTEIGRGMGLMADCGYMEDTDTWKVLFAIAGSEIKGIIRGIKIDPKYEREPGIYLNKICEIRSLGFKEKMRCLNIADESHHYLSTDYVMTCNSGKDSIAKMIASEWNRNIYYVTGGKNGKYIPNAIVDEGEDVIAPLILISDIDKYPSVITEATVDMKDEKGGAKEEQLQYKQVFGNMINALDGVLSAEGRIIIMTTNHIEKFSEVFRRPGRINLEMEIGYVTPEVFRQYVADFYHRTLPEKFTLKDEDLTVAKMQQEVIYYKLTADEFIAKHVK